MIIAADAGANPAVSAKTEPMKKISRHGGRLLADQLAVQGIRRVFSVPGESFLALLDGLLETDIDNVVCRHEGGAAMMAEAHGKMTGRPGVAVVTRGPGAANASCGVHVASHDSTPMLLLVGQVPRNRRGREAFQEIDIPGFFRPIAKWTAEIEQADRIPEFLTRAFRTAMSGRPGPVVLSLPEDMLHERTPADDGALVPAAHPPVSDSDAQGAAERLMKSERPVVIIGGSLWSETSARSLGRLSRKFGLPVAASFRRQHYLDNRHENYIGDLSGGMNPKLAALVRESDCLVALGCRLADFPTQGYRVPGRPEETRLAVHVYPDPDEIGRIWPADQGIAAAPEAFLLRMEQFDPPGSKARIEWLRRARPLYEEWQRPAPLPGPAQFSAVMKWLSANLPQDAILTNGAGNYAAFVHRYFCFKRFGTQIAPTSGSMGYGLPAAIAAKLEHPDRIAVCLAGDGCLQMTLNEMASAVQRRAGVIVIVANNGMYGTIRMHQEIHFPGRRSGTSLVNPDFAEIARAFGGHGETVAETSEFPPAFERALSSGLPAIIDVRLDPEAIATDRTLQEIAASGAPS